MSFLTDRKLAVGLGAAKHGADHHWFMITSSIGLLVLIPLFIFTFGCALGGTYEEVLAYYSRPFPSIVAGLTIIVSMLHMMRGWQMMVEDYTSGFFRKFLVIGMNFFCYALIAAGLFSLVKLAL
ncbi:MULTISPECIES: succinate dehydrogenase, hydrophobic membrane anchor protein [Roseobacteraceae]|jgi:succinate dehydrogenase / fumarate reductase membrane anchor subunit|uniref:Succinate dehydrogenase, hydrophobic membrane anchor protein n=2 Tax=Celeribacter baekdonensis TaxID=875171 RepID=K2JEL8_9RHOB|nr:MULTISPECIES: succinate dehydrogenase, hydrophobic membrane anchor protein [Roseobacteraceae]AVW92069.1 succinate dehydrogenase [Celeribacter baekdonensis]EKE69054.1 succinate dehydrogenase, hydrophobic membrane anchor protein [Celeribacter baekdonensis B30]KAB6715186.1 succinate dehydrogenase [Roseobacter sp. TSBP12]|tara:strand:+ start:95022 stop:95393 length:372 start_codon:yes stop_codon:yes gene_type:complete|eukprot:TRINITY_DN21327_c0_g1_i1.p3 TRINITY_DN21327_c0_g1~~TRINITY_DN21327_c0_g1_i1.p3  ORF type:complete len:124 (-),score=10.61 TRINITY_DN21327_c0_g1_i1:69-440(-)